MVIPFVVDNEPPSIWITEPSLRFDWNGDGMVDDGYDGNEDYDGDDFDKDGDVDMGDLCASSNRVACDIPDEDMAPYEEMGREDILEPRSTICDGIDNDLDGVVDELDHNENPYISVYRVSHAGGELTTFPMPVSFRIEDNSEGVAALGRELVYEIYREDESGDPVFRKIFVEPDLGTDYSGTWSFERGSEGSADFVMDDGLYSLRVGVTDAAENKTISSSAFFIIDNKPPTVQVSRSWHDEQGLTMTLNQNVRNFGFDFIPGIPTTTTDCETDHIRVEFLPVDNDGVSLGRDPICRYMPVGIKDELTYDVAGVATDASPDGKPDPILFRLPVNKPPAIESIPDGRYRVTVTAFDQAGNSSVITSLSTIDNGSVLVIDREAPVLYEHAVSPVLLKGGVRTIDLTLDISESRDDIVNRSINAGNELTLVSLKLNDITDIATTVSSITPDPDGVTELRLNALGIPSELADGRHTIRAAVGDAVGNIGYVEGVFFHNTIGAFLDAPGHGDTVYAKTVIRGTINDPKEGNNKAFINYELDLVRRSDGTSHKAALETPDGGTVSTKSVPLNGIVGFLDPAGLIPGHYTIVAHVYERGLSAPTELLSDIYVNPTTSAVLPTVSMTAPSTFSSGVGTYEFSYTVSGGVADILAEISGSNGVVYKATHAGIVPFSGSPAQGDNYGASVLIGELSDGTIRMEWNGVIELRVASAIGGLSTAGFVKTNPNIVLRDEKGEAVIETIVRNTGGYYRVDIHQTELPDADITVMVRNGGTAVAASSIRFGSGSIPSEQNPVRLKRKRTFSWDGSTLHGGIADNGTYKVSLTAVGTSGTGYDRKEQDVSVTLQPPLRVWRDTPGNCVGSGCSHIEADAFYSPTNPFVVAEFHVNKVCDATIRLILNNNGQRTVLRSDELKDVVSGSLQTVKHKWDGIFPSGRGMNAGDNLAFEVVASRAQSGETDGPLVIPISYNPPWQPTPNGADALVVSGGLTGSHIASSAMTSRQVVSGDASAKVSTAFSGRVYHPVRLGYKLNVTHKNSATIRTTVQYTTSLNVRGLVEVYPTKSRYEPQRTGCHSFTETEAGKLLGSTWYPRLSWSRYGVDGNGNYVGQCKDKWNAWIRSDYRPYSSGTNWNMKRLPEHESGGIASGDYPRLPSMTDKRIPLIYIDVTNHEHDKSGLNKIEYVSDGSGKYYKFHFAVEGTGGGIGDFGYRPHLIYYRDYGNLAKSNIVPEMDRVGNRLDEIGLLWNNPSYRVKTFVENKYPSPSSCLPYSTRAGFIDNFQYYYSISVPGGHWTGSASYTIRGTDPNTNGGFYNGTNGQQVHLRVEPYLIFSNGRFLRLSRLSHMCNLSNGMPYNNNSTKDSYRVYEWILKSTENGGHIVDGTPQLITELSAKDCRLLGTIGTDKHLAYKIVDTDVTAPGHTVTIHDFTESGDIQTIALDQNATSTGYETLALVPSVPVDPTDDITELQPVVYAVDGTLLNDADAKTLVKVEANGASSYKLTIDEAAAEDLGFIVDWDPQDPGVDGLLASSAGKLVYPVQVPEKIGYWPDVNYRDEYVKQAGGTTGSQPLFSSSGSRNPNLRITGISSDARYVDDVINKHVEVTDNFVEGEYQNSVLTLKQTAKGRDVNIVTLKLADNLHPNLEYWAIDAIVDGRRMNIISDVRNGTNDQVKWDAGYYSGEVSLLLSYYNLAGATRVNETTYGQVSYIGYIIDADAYGNGNTNRVAHSSFRHAEIIYDGPVWALSNRDFSLSEGRTRAFDLHLADNELTAISAGREIRVDYRVKSTLTPVDFSMTIIGRTESGNWTEISDAKLINVPMMALYERRSISFTATTIPASMTGLGIKIVAVNRTLEGTIFSVKALNSGSIYEPNVSSIHPIQASDLFIKGSAPSIGLSVLSPIISVKPSPVTFPDERRPTLYYRLLPNQVQGLGISRSNMARIFHVNNMTGALTNITTGYARAMNWDGTVTFDETAPDFDTRILGTGWDYLELVAAPKSFSSFAALPEVSTILDRYELDEGVEFPGPSLTVKGTFVPYVSPDGSDPINAKAEGCSLVVNFDQNLNNRTIDNVRGRAGNVVRVIPLDPANTRFEVSDITVPASLKNGDSVYVYSYPYNTSLANKAGVSLSYTVYRLKYASLGFTLVPVKQYLSSSTDVGKFKILPQDRSGLLLVEQYGSVGQSLGSSLHDVSLEQEIAVTLSGNGGTLAEGRYPFLVVATDGAGNHCETCKSTAAFVVDYTKPAIQSFQQGENTSGKTQTLRLSCSDNQELGDVAVQVTDSEGEVLFRWNMNTEGTQYQSTVNVSVAPSWDNIELTALVTVTDAAGNTQSRTTSFIRQTPIPEKISPVLERVVEECDGGFTGWFGYSNPNPGIVNLSVGSNNKFSGTGDIDAGQTTSFLPGRHRDVFTVPFSGGNIVWTLMGRTSTAGAGAAVRECSLEPISPVLERVDKDCEYRYTAYFGYDNPNGEAVTIAVGDRNKMTGMGSADMGQPTTFLVGRQHNVFSMAFTGDNVVWSLDGKTATAGKDAAVNICSVQPVSPVLERVLRTCDQSYIAEFGYDNPNDFAINIEAGLKNGFSYHGQTGSLMGQPEEFLSGRRNSVFTVSFDGSDLVWSLTGKTATASSAQAADECAVTLESAFAFGMDATTIAVSGVAGVSYTKVVQNGSNFLYDDSRGYGYTDTSDIDGSLNNRGRAACEIYDQFIGVKKGGDIVFRVDVPNGEYRFVAAGSDGKYSGHTITLSVRDGSSGTTLVLVNDWKQDVPGQAYAVKHNTRIPPTCSNVDFVSTFESPTLKVSGGYIDIIQSTSGIGGDLCLIEIWREGNAQP